ncbi:MAG: hypothetical protein JSV27_07075 [Candidatus Bathyarchaeota archaeon]|nr:MAG: hypothetical protein JSV27_07075 [Candidatus Bathyarchaeota archaeon]
MSDRPDDQKKPPVESPPLPHEEIDVVDVNDILKEADAQLPPIEEIETPEAPPEEDKVIRLRFRRVEAPIVDDYLVGESILDPSSARTCVNVIFR